MPTEPTNPYEILDVFTDRPLEGNPLAVFTEGEAIPSRLMQAVARELHLSETVFLLPGDDSFDAQLRIFTPKVELPFAGHPTLGAAFVVGERGNLATVTLLTGAGLLPVTLTREHGEIIYGEMEQPFPEISALANTAPLLRALGISAVELPVDVYANGPEHVMVALDSPEQVAMLEPQWSEMMALPGVLGLPNLTISCFAKVAGSDIKTRVFCPGVSVPEDPATGSAAGPLALHLARYGWTKFGQELQVTQGVEILRPSRITARVDGSAEQIERIVVGGSAVRVGHGHFRLQ